MKLSIQSQNLVDTFGAKQAYSLIREAGFEAIDWNIDTAWDFDEVKKSKELKNLCIFEKSLDEIRELKRKLQVLSTQMHTLLNQC